MTSIGTLAQSQQTVQLLGQLQTQASTLESQISTGIKSQSFAGISADASHLVDLQAETSRQQSYIDTIDTVTTRVQTMNLAVGSIEKLASQFSEKLPQGAFDTTPGASIQQEAQQLLVELGGYLNTQDGSRFVFAGNNTQTPPFDPNGLPSPGSPSVSVGGAPPAGYYTGDSAIAQATIDNNTNLKYGITGNNPAFEQIVRVLNYFATTPGPLSQANATDSANVAQATQLMGDAVQKLEQMQGQIGLQEQELNDASKAHTDTINLAQNSITTMIKVDPATAITELNTLQTQLQASYQTVNILSNLSLASYLK